MRASVHCGIDGVLPMGAPRSEIVRQADRLELQSVAVLVDAELSCSSALLARLQQALARFLDLVPGDVDAWQGAGYSDALSSVQVDNFGHGGNSIFFNCWGVGSPGGTWQSHAEDVVMQHAASSERASKDGLVHKRVFSYAEYAVEARDSEPFSPSSGSLLRENGFRRSQDGD